MALPASQYAGGGSIVAPPVQNATATPFTVDLNGGDIVVTFAGATTCNIPAPTAGQDDFKRIKVFSTTAFAHILAFGANKLNGNKTSFTWTKAVAGLIGEFIAFNGVWYGTVGIADVAAYAQQVTLA